MNGGPVSKDSYAKPSRQKRIFFQKKKLIQAVAQLSSCVPERPNQWEEELALFHEMLTIES